MLKNKPKAMFEMKSVLIVEPDELRAAELLRWLRDGGFAADVVSTREAAQQFLTANNVSVLVFAEHAGFDALPFLWRASHVTRVPTIILGSQSSAKNAMFALNLGADCYMPKPHSPREVLARIRSLTRPFA